MTEQTRQNAIPAGYRVHTLGQQIQGRGCEGSHVRDAVPLPGFHGDGALDRPGNGQTGVSRRIPVPVARGARRSRLGQGPGGGEALARRLRQAQGVRLGCRPDLPECRRRQIEEHLPGGVSVNDRTAEEVCGGPRHGQQGGRDEAAGGRLGNGHGFAPILQEDGHPFSKGEKIFHGLSFLGKVFAGPMVREGP